MSKVFHSRIHGPMNKRRRRQMGFGRYRREEVWRLMAAEEVKIARARWWLRLRWWQRLLYRAGAAVKRTLRRAFQLIRSKG